jgi:hypothetical protein
MSLCTEVGHWITEYIEKPVEQFLETTKQQCTEVRRWVEREVRKPIETWRQQQEQRCREQECNWWCLCCNKWVCVLVTVLVKVIEWVIEIVGEWLIETVCHLIVEIIRVIVMVLIKVTRWVVEAVVCIVERFCAYLIFLAGVALIAVLLAGVLSAGAVLLPGGTVALATSVIAAVGALLIALALCELGWCRLLGVIFWALKWAIVIGMVISVSLLSAACGFVVVLYGGASATLLWLLVRRGCAIPRMLAWP